MIGELELLGIVAERLQCAGIEYMLTGSFALAFYATPRMTRDIDLVVALSAEKVEALALAFAPDFYIDADDARAAVRDQRMFNLMHLESGIKVDMIVRKSDAYRETEFARRRSIRVGNHDFWIVSREDLILSKLLWARDGGSELQIRDVRALAQEEVDRDYLRRWAPRLGVVEALEAAWT
jgi:hypothetical protein